MPRASKAARPKKLTQKAVRAFEPPVRLRLYRIPVLCFRGSITCL